jgi:hypothetical protein
MKFKVTHAGQGAGYNVGDTITISEEHKTLKQIASEVNAKANLSVSDIGLIQGNHNKMYFGTRLDGITFQTTVLIIEKVKDHGI